MYSERSAPWRCDFGSNWPTAGRWISWPAFQGLHHKVWRSLSFEPKLPLFDLIIHWSLQWINMVQLLPTLSLPICFCPNERCCFVSEGNRTRCSHQCDLSSRCGCKSVPRVRGMFRISQLKAAWAGQKHFKWNLQTKISRGSAVSQHSMSQLFHMHTCADVHVLLTAAAFLLLSLRAQTWAAHRPDSGIQSTLQKARSAVAERRRELVVVRKE